MSRIGRRPYDNENAGYGGFSRTSSNSKNSELYTARIIQKNLVYVIGLAPEISNEKELAQEKYFGQYGKITKVVVKKDKPFNPRGNVGPTYSAYVTFSNDKEASLAILAVDDFRLYERIVKASYGTTKYCNFFLRNQKCPNGECLYLHKLAKDEDSFPKVVGYKTIFREQQQNVLGHLSRYSAEVLAMKTDLVSEAIFPDIQEAIAKLRVYCSSLKIPNKPKKPKKTIKCRLQPVKWEEDSEEYDSRNQSESLLNDTDDLYSNEQKSEPSSPESVNIIVSKRRSNRNKGGNRNHGGSQRQAKSKKDKEINSSKHTFDEDFVGLLDADEHLEGAPGLSKLTTPSLTTHMSLGNPSSISFPMEEQSPTKKIVFLPDSQKKNDRTPIKSSIEASTRAQTNKGDPLLSGATPKTKLDYSHPSKLTQRDRKDQQITKDSGHSSMIPQDLQEGMSNIERMVLQKFTKSLNCSEKSEAYKKSCKKFVILMRSFLEQDPSKDNVPPIKEKVDQKTATSTRKIQPFSESKWSAPVEHEGSEDFKLFDQHYTINLKQGNLRGYDRSRIRHGRATSGYKTKMVDNKGTRSTPRGQQNSKSYNTKRK